jgi:hypothetical protein
MNHNVTFDTVRREKGKTAHFFEILLQAIWAALAFQRHLADALPLARMSHIQVQLLCLPPAGGKPPFLKGETIWILVPVYES